MNKNYSYRLSTFFLFLSTISGCTHTSYPLPCAYSSSSWEEDGYSTHHNCARDNGRGLELAPYHFAKLQWSEHHLATVFVPDQGFYYINQDGRARRTPAFDNGPDYFSANRVRYIEDGKYGFVDESLDPVIPAQFDFAFPFGDRYAVVCNGCRREVSADEHSSIEGGSWGVVGLKGEVVLPVDFGRDEVLSRVRILD